ncbi:MAG: hypothetical protein WB816_00830 [Methylocystis sp.]
MGKKDLASVTTDLSALASMMPTQKPVFAPPPPLVLPPAPKPVSANASLGALGETPIQFSLSMRKELRKQLARLASEADMTMRAFVLHALKEKGLAVRDDDLIDLRKERR